MVEEDFPRAELASCSRAGLRAGNKQLLNTSKTAAGQDESDRAPASDTHATMYPQELYWMSFIHNCPLAASSSHCGWLRSSMKALPPVRSTSASSMEPCLIAS